MKTKTTVAVVIGAALLAGTVMASTAFTSATVTRSASVGVVNDTGGQIALTEGGAGGDAVGFTNNELQVNLDSVNVDSTYQYGADGASASGDAAFVLTNNAASDKSVSLSMSGTGGFVTFEVYDSGGTSLGTVSDSGGFSDTMTSGSSWYVVVTADTTGTNSKSTNSGTFTISAS
jgi:hypothetical protein